MPISLFVFDIRRNLHSFTPLEAYAFHKICFTGDCWYLTVCFTGFGAILRISCANCCCFIIFVFLLFLLRAVIG